VPLSQRLDRLIVREEETRATQSSIAALDGQFREKGGDGCRC
jgi:hypothetical protein